MKYNDDDASGILVELFEVLIKNFVSWKYGISDKKKYTLPLTIGASGNGKTRLNMEMMRLFREKFDYYILLALKEKHITFDPSGVEEFRSFINTSDTLILPIRHGGDNFNDNIEGKMEAHVFLAYRICRGYWFPDIPIDVFYSRINDAYPGYATDNSILYRLSEEMLQYPRFSMDQNAKSIPKMLHIVIDELQFLTRKDIVYQGSNPAVTATTKSFGTAVGRKLLEFSITSQQLFIFPVLCGTLLRREYFVEVNCLNVILPFLRLFRVSFWVCSEVKFSLRFFQQFVCEGMVEPRLRS